MNCWDRFLERVKKWKVSISTGCQPFFLKKTRREILRNVTSQEGSFRTLGNKGHWVFWWWGQWWWCCCASSIEKWSSISSHVLTTNSMYGFQCCVEGSRGVKRKQWAYVVWIDCRPKTSAHQHGQSIFEYDDLFSGWWVQQGRQVDGDRHVWCVQVVATGLLFRLSSEARNLWKGWFSPKTLSFCRCCSGFRRHRVDFQNVPRLHAVAL